MQIYKRKVTDPSTTANTTATGPLELLAALVNCEGVAVVVVKYTAGRVPDAAPLFRVKILAGVLTGYGLSVAVDATTLTVIYCVVVLVVVQVE
jgi:hypothetical protein